MSKRKGKLKWKNIILTIILLISIGGLVYSLINFIDWTKDNKITNEQIDVIEEITTVEEVSTGEAVNAEEETPESIYWSYIKMNMINVDFSDLKEENKGGF